jgi:hypothetical protein
MLKYLPTSGEPYISLGRSMSHNSARFSIPEYDECITLAALQKNIQAPSIFAILKENDNNSFRSKLMTSYLLQASEKPTTALNVLKTDQIFPIDRLHHYTFFSKNYTGDEMHSMETFMNPIMTPACAPTRCLQNDKACIEQRVRQFSKFENESPFRQDIIKLMKAYVDHYFNDNPNFIKFRLCDVEEVLEHCKRPSQTNALLETMNEPPTPKFTTFAKAECQGKFTTPRNISTVSTPLKREYSRFVYPASDWIKSQEWYAFGQTPREITERLINMLKGAMYGTEGDGHRWDGHIKAIMRALDMMMIHGMVHPDDVPYVLEQYGKTFNTKGHTKFGVVYATGTTQGSGVPDTSFFNSNRCHFGSVYAKFLDLKHITDFDKRALLAITTVVDIVGGDDNFCVDIPAETFRTAMEHLGQDFVVVNINKGCSFTFLSRTFLGDIWYGSPQSHCDIRRTMSKFHSTTKLVGFTPKEKLLEKTFALSLTDRNTPICKELVEAVSRLLRKENLTLEHNTNTEQKSFSSGWWSTYPVEDQFQNDLPDKMFPNLPPEFDYDAYVDYMSKVETFEQIIKIPLFDTYNHILPTNIISNGNYSKLSVKDIIEPEPFSKSQNETDPWALAVEAHAPVAQITAPKEIKQSDKIFHFNRCLTTAGKIGPFKHVIDIGCGDNFTSVDYFKALTELTPDSHFSTVDPGSSPKGIFRLGHTHYHFISDVAKDVNTGIRPPIDFAIFSMSIHHIRDFHNFIEFLLQIASPNLFIYIREHDFDNIDLDALKAAHLKYNDTSEVFPTTRSNLIHNFHNLNFKKIATSNYAKKCPNLTKTYHILMQRDPLLKNRNVKINKTLDSVKPPINASNSVKSPIIRKTSIKKITDTKPSNNITPINSLSVAKEVVVPNQDPISMIVLNNKLPDVPITPTPVLVTSSHDTVTTSATTTSTVISTSPAILNESVTTPTVIPPDSLLTSTVTSDSESKSSI